MEASSAARSWARHFRLLTRPYPRIVGLTVCMPIFSGPESRRNQLFMMWETEMQVASLDHAMWFHRDFRMDDWLLYVMKSSNACKARGLSDGKIYTRQGQLVASVAQEGLIRYHALNR